MGWASNVDLEQREMFEQDADTLTEEDFVAKHGEILHGEANTVQGAWKYTINAR